MTFEKYLRIIFYQLFDKIRLTERVNFLPEFNIEGGGGGRGRASFRAIIVFFIRSRSRGPVIIVSLQSVTRLAPRYKFEHQSLLASTAQRGGFPDGQAPRRAPRG